MSTIKLSVFQLVKEFNKNPDVICKILQDKLFSDYETSSEKGMITINIKSKLTAYNFPIVNTNSDKAFTAIIKGVNRQDAENKARVKFPYPLYKFEWE